MFGLDQMGWICEHRSILTGRMLLKAATTPFTGAGCGYVPLSS